MDEGVAAGLVGIGGTIAGALISWVLGQRAKESDKLRTIYSDWASKAHRVLTIIESIQLDANLAAVEEGASSGGNWDAGIRFGKAKLAEDTRLFRLRLALDRARFKVAISDDDEDRLRAVKDQTERLLRLTDDTWDADLPTAKNELEALVTGELRSAFKLRSRRPNRSPRKARTDAPPPLPSSSPRTM